MLEKIYQIIDEGFANAPDNAETREIKEQIKLDAADKYADKIAQGKSEQEAFDAVREGLGELRDIAKELHGNNFENMTEGGGRVNAAELREVDISWVNGRVELDCCDGDEITFYETSERGVRSPMVWRVNFGRLEIKYAKIMRGVGNWFSEMRTGGKTLVISIPRGSNFDVVKVGGVNSELNVSGEGWRARQIHLSSVNGKAVGRKMTGGSVSANSVNGPVSLNIESADLVKMDTVNGPLKLIVDEKMPGFSVKYAKVNGAFSCDFPVMVQKNRAVYGDGSLDVHMATVNGPISVVKG